MYWIFPGLAESLSCLSGHHDVDGVARVSLMNRAAVPGHSAHIAAHHVTSGMKPVEDFRYSELHSHDHDEICVLLSERSTLTYLFEVDGERFQVSSPASVLISAHATHRMEAISGEGTFLCIYLPSESEVSHD